MLKKMLVVPLLFISSALMSNENNGESLRDTEEEWMGDDDQNIRLREGPPGPAVSAEETERFNRVKEMSLWELERNREKLEEGREKLIESGDTRNLPALNRLIDFYDKVLKDRKEGRLNRLSDNQDDFEEIEEGQDFAVGGGGPSDEERLREGLKGYDIPLTEALLRDYKEMKRQGVPNIDSKIKIIEEALQAKKEEQVEKLREATTGKWPKGI